MKEKACTDKTMPGQNFRVPTRHALTSFSQMNFLFSLIACEIYKLTYNLRKQILIKIENDVTIDFLYQIEQYKLLEYMHK